MARAGTASSTRSVRHDRLTFGLGHRIEAWTKRSTGITSTRPTDRMVTTAGSSPATMAGQSSRGSLRRSALPATNPGRATMLPRAREPGRLSSCSRGSPWDQERIAIARPSPRNMMAPMVTSTRAVFGGGVTVFIALSLPVPEIDVEKARSFCPGRSHDVADCVARSGDDHGDNLRLVLSQPVGHRYDVAQRSS